MELRLLLLHLLHVLHLCVARAAEMSHIAVAKRVAVELDVEAADFSIVAILKHLDVLALAGLGDVGAMCLSLNDENIVSILRCFCGAEQ